MSRIIGAPDQRILDMIETRAVHEVRQLVREWKYADGGVDLEGVGPYPVIGETPIERTFFAALSSLVQFRPREIDRLFVSVPAEARDVLATVCMPLFVDPQQTIIGWRVDFLITVPARCPRRSRGIVVECDGHDFHERTKEQAERDRSRDRRMQDAGFTVFRFTGSEITRYPWECAEAVVDFACGEVCGHPGPHVLPPSLEERRRAHLDDESTS